MKRLSSILCFLGISFLAQAQVGVAGIYTQLQMEDAWRSYFENSDAYNFEQGYQFPAEMGAEIHYRLYPLNNRIEFFPTLGYLNVSDSRFYTDVPPQQGMLPESTFEQQLVYFSIPIHFYPLDFDGDCDCPTWGKDGSIIEKGFYISLIPGLSFFQQTIKSELLQLDESSSQTVFHAGLGTGIDFGINKIVTLTPFAQYKRHFGRNWEMLAPTLLEPTAEPTTETAAQNQWVVGLRLGLHFKR